MLNTNAKLSKIHVSSKIDFRRLPVIDDGFEGTESSVASVVDNGCRGADSSATSVWAGFKGAISIGMFGRRSASPSSLSLRRVGGRRDEKVGTQENI